mmetsp:Transcript_13108/g.18926  ORF Transcript_13108/g.18926 Transcript_13108/m.18926 type:complete len:204 (+) Transcript_13108:87-698(+)|eukprot:CAMPEP_0195520504 /NCGR_PEP_ID=MMETSP0794_2-20130614/17067_1 /TAXON_ID=515487 /ORGANISM="Stephanopyxis turris, Strain CCMP 815" /LENGTH=203 /DNA_ID=CAMNT_0040649881 /DNA_START=87 /DNA_END=698 /DNA_ORIENTATION=-
MKTICLTGGIASGKSTAVQYLKDKNAHVIDADKLGHKAYEPGQPANEALVQTFGDDVRGDDGQINRKVLGSKVFGKPDELKKLTDIVWPEIRRLAESEIRSIRETDPDKIVALEAAILFEAGWEDIGDDIWVITVDRETAISRSIQRDNFTREDVEKRLNSQLSNEERTARAGLVITNNGTKDEYLAQLDAAWTTRVVNSQSK